MPEIAGPGGSAVAQAPGAAVIQVRKIGIFQFLDFGYTKSLRNSQKNLKQMVRQGTRLSKSCRTDF